MAKNIAILAPSPAPYLLGGAEKLYSGLCAALGRMPDTFTEMIKLPCREGSFEDLIQAYKMYYELDLSHFDMIISTKYPSWMAWHKNHVVYMLHKLRGFYDTWWMTGMPDDLSPVPSAARELYAFVNRSEATREDLPELFDLCARALKNKTLPFFIFAHPGPLLRKIVHFMDRIALSPENIRAYMAISRNVAERKDYFPLGVPVEVIYPPTDLERIVEGKARYILSVSRLHSTKRIESLIEAMRYVDADVKLKIAGIGPESEALKKLAARDPRIEFCGFVPDEKLPELYAGALFVPFIPLDEDYGLVTIEAMRAGKTVITFKDSGGVREFVEHGKNGLCVEPTAEALGSAINQLLADPDLRDKMGREARKTVENINWSNVAERIMSYAEYSPLTQLKHKKPLVLVFSAYPANRAGGGGEKRLWHLCDSLRDKYSVLVISVGTRKSRIMEVRQEADDFSQMIWAWPECGKGVAELLRNRDLTSVDDVQIMDWCGKDSKFVNVIKELAQDAVCVIASQPYLMPAIRSAELNLPLIYAAPDVETDVKEKILLKSPELWEAVRVHEEVCLKQAVAVFACSSENRQRFHELYGTDLEKIFVLPNGVDRPEAIFRTPGQRRKERRQLPFGWAKLVFFIGSGHQPNKEAVRQIFDIARKLPDVQFIIAGTVSTDLEIERTKRPANAHLAGAVSEAVKKELLAICDLAINPVSSGSGTNLKIVEYLAAGLPCVSTPFGMRGMDAMAKKIVKICELADFPEAIREALNHPPSAAELAATAEHVKKTYSWPVTMGNSSALLTAALRDA